jgi:hypothetical protein
MFDTAGAVLKAADGVVGISGKPVRVFGLHVLSGGTAGIVKLYNGTTASGTLYVQQTCGTVSTGNLFEYGNEGFLFPNGCFYEEVVDANVTSTLISFRNEPISEKRKGRV